MTIFETYKWFEWLSMVKKYKMRQKMLVKTDRQPLLVSNNNNNNFYSG